MAKQSNGRLWFEAGIDRSQLSRGVTAINKDFAGLQGNAARTGTAFSNMWSTAAAGVGAYLTATAALDMGKQIIDLTRQRELMEKSFEVMLGGADAAAKKIEEINEYAIFSPYTFDGVAKGVQTMSAFGVATEDLMPTLRMLGDVAAGNQQRFESLSLVYGQIQSAGRLMGQDLLQLINAGFNPLQIISAQTGQSMLDLKKQMEDGRISFDMVADAFKSATSEGGKFYGMTAKMADSIEAAKSTFESAWVEKQIEWGKAARDNIQTMYEFGTVVVDNADEIAKAFAVLIATVGSYKAAMIATSVTQAAMAGAGNIKAFFSLAKSVRSVKDAMVLLNIATKANPIGIIISALTLAVGAFVAFRKEAKSTEDVIGDLDTAVKEFEDRASQTSKLADRYEELRSKTELTKDETSELNTIMGQLIETVPDAAGVFDEYGNVLDVNIGKVREFNEAQKEAARITLEDTIKQGEARLAELEKQAAKEQGIFQTGTKTVRRSQTQSYQVTASPEEQLEAAKNFQTLDAEAQKLRASVEAARASLSGLNQEAAKKAAEAEAAKKAAEAEAAKKAAEAEAEAAKKAAEAAKKAAEAEAEARRKMYEQGLLDYETFQQGVERLAKEHTDRVAAYEAEASPKQLTQLTTGSEAQMNAEIEALHEKHQTEEYLNEQAFQKRKEANAEYLKEYGTAAQKMLEITQRYAEQISEATTGAEKKLLSKQRDTELASITSSEFTQQMDWVSILGGAGDQFNEIVEKALKDSREYLNTDEFKNASAETKKTLVDAIQRMEGVLSDDSGLDFQSVGNAMQEYQNSVLELNTAKIEEAEAIKKLTEAQEAYAKALKEGTDADKKSAGVALENAQANTDAASQNVQTLTEQSQGAMQNVQEASQKLKAGMDGVVSGLSSILSGDSLRGIWDGLINIGDSLDGALGKMAESMKSVPIVGWILSILDLIKDGLVPLLSNIGDLIAGIIDTATEETFSGQIFVAIFDLVKKILISAADAITLGAFDLSGRRKAIIEETNKQNAELAQQEYLAQYEINQLYRERYEWEKKIGETAMENAKRNTAEAEKQLKATGDEEAKILKKLQGQEYIEGYSTKKTGLFGWGKGKTVENRASLSGMGYDEILELEAQGKLTEEAQEYLNALRASKEEGEDLADTLIEAQEALREAVVGMGFDDVVNHAMDDLLDGTKTAAEAFDEIMQGAMTKMLQEMMNDDIRDWYEGFAAAGEDGYTQAEKEYWKARWEDVQRKNEQAKEDIEEITGEDFDMGTQGQADANAITAIQEEAPGSIDGKLTALQISSSQTATNTSILVVGQSNTQASILEMRDGMDTLNGNVRLIYKEAKLIKEYTSELPEMAKNIKQVVTNTSKL